MKFGQILHKNLKIFLDEYTMREDSLSKGHISRKDSVFSKRTNHSENFQILANPKQKQTSIIFTQFYCCFCPWVMTLKRDKISSRNIFDDQNMSNRSQKPYFHQSESYMHVIWNTELFQFLKKWRKCRMLEKQSKMSIKGLSSSTRLKSDEITALLK